MRLSILVIPFVSLLLLNFSYAGGIVAGGGDTAGQEFTSLGQSVSRFLFQLDPANAPVDPKEFANAVTTTIVRSDEHAMLGKTWYKRGQEVDAINFPVERRILINRSRWKQNNDEQKLSLAMHEYLGILGLDDKNYQISGPFLREHGKLILISGTPVTYCTVTGRLQLTQSQGSRPVGEISVEKLVFNTRTPISPFDPPAIASPTFWIDFNTALEAPNVSNGKVTVTGDADLLRRGLGQLLTNEGRRQTASGMVETDEAKRIRLFAVITPNFASEERYGALDRHVQSIAGDAVYFSNAGEDWYMFHQSFDLHCEK
ncbi:MAG: hypothetical protein A2428_17910 [Bdellovibrionales bacterium RIFOXYC1_FULL_54_43]|nr:MAG: hypothetical protein A2428_17910 [Bdellovibrionales bacterium RIFOXYC1_FULL_54_43]OFZ79697.1 MAG: hypothetical protein A2603_06100 [Bdellovibrionales bacterium RIFOXYD1_FULL_55_31]